jgi:hypothetical protein
MVRRLLYSNRTTRGADRDARQELPSALLLETSRPWFQAPPVRWAFWKTNMNNESDNRLSAALLGFNGEALPYCRAISDLLAREYAMNYATMLTNRAKGMDSQLPRVPYGLFAPNRNLIQATLDRMHQKYFAAK